MSGDFEGRVALAVGSGSGIGRAAAQIFAARGAAVVVATREEDGGRETVHLIEAAGGKAAFFQVDASSEAAIRDMVAFVIDTYGRLDVAHNNVGDPGPFGGLPDIALEDFERCHRLNTVSCFLAMKYEIPEMLKLGRGAIVNTSSLAGIIGNPGASAYCSAKHAVVGLTKTAALEFATRNIRVNAVCPGATDTPMLRNTASQWAGDTEEFLKDWVEPMGRLGTAQELGEAAVWLCSDAASFITGHIMPVDGGHVAGNRAITPDMK